MTGPQASRREWLALGAAGAALGALPVAAAGRSAGTALRLSVNENAFGPSPSVARAVARAAAGLERYVEQPEVDALARQIAALEGVAPDQVVLGELLEALGLFLARRQRGGEIVYSAPGYTALSDAAEALGGRSRPVPLGRDLCNDLPALARAIGPRTSAVSLVNPHNPTGTVNDLAAFDEFIATASGRTLVVVDEAYLEYGDLAGHTAVRQLRAGRNVLVFRTLAKIYGLAGLSFGYAVAPAALAAELRTAGIGAPHSLSRPAIAAAAAALADQRHVGRVRAAVQRERARYDALIDARGWPRTNSVANFVFFKPPHPDELRRRFADQGIAIGRPFTPLDDWLRITVGLPRENDAVLSELRSWQSA